MTAPAPVATELRPIREAEPEILGGVRVYRNVRATGRELIEMDAAQPGIFNGSKWMDCDLDGTEWPAELHDVTIVDSSLRNSVWQLRRGENIRIMGTVRIPVHVEADYKVVANLNGIRARVDGMRVSGYAPGFTLVQVAGEGVHLGDVDTPPQEGTTHG